MKNFLKELNKHVKSLEIEGSGYIGKAWPLKRAFSWRVNYSYNKIKDNKLQNCAMYEFIPGSITSIYNRDIPEIKKLAKKYEKEILIDEELLSLCFFIDRTIKIQIANDKYAVEMTFKNPNTQKEERQTFVTNDYEEMLNRVIQKSY